MTTTASGIQGVGISYRPEFADFQHRLAASVDCVEVIFENTFLPGVDGVEALAWDVPKVTHALSFSPARADFRIDPGTRPIFDAARAAGVTMVSDHLSFSAVGEYSVPNFMDATRTTAEADRIAANLRALRDASGMAVAVENAVTFLSDPGDELTEVQFACRVLESADCGMLLDVNNLHVNAVNHGYDPFDYLDRLDGDRVSYLHVAGHDTHGGVLVDSHGADIAPAVWDLLSHALRRTAASAVILERDNLSATEDGLLAELAMVRDVWSAARRVPAAPGRG